MSKDVRTKRINPHQKLVVDLSQHLVAADERRPIRCIAVEAVGN